VLESKAAAQISCCICGISHQRE